jgi:hypothetical protein
MSTRKKTFAIGFLIGLLIPIIGFFLIKGLFFLLTYFGLMDPISPSIADRRFRTITLLSICLNVFPVHFYRLRGTDEFLRGVISACFAYIIIWIFYFSSSLLLL